MAKKYTTEKVLYLADQRLPLHVAPSEYTRGTDLALEVERLIGLAELEKVGEDDAGDYYKTTDKGRVKLLKLRIDWCKRSGRTYGGHQRALDALTNPEN